MRDWAGRRPLLALGGLALAARLACAALTEATPLFPPYYYTDARLFHAAAVAALQAENEGRPAVFEGPRSFRLHSRFVHQIYRWAGPRPLAVKAVNAALGAAGVALLAWMLGFVFSREAALVSGLLVALWPSHIFFTSQNLKEAPGNLLAYAGLAFAVAAGLFPGASRARRSVFAASAAASTIAAGFYRPPVLTALAAAGAAAFVFGMLRGSLAERARALAGLAFVSSLLALYAWMSRGTHFYEAQLVPAVSLEAIDHYRSEQHRVGREAAKRLGDRTIGTAIFPDARFLAWSDLLAFLPKGAFYALFMPFPGLYPLENKAGRWAAAAENVVLLLIAGLAALGVIRGPLSPARLGLLVFAGTLAAGAALFEIDLGAAGRHKLLYLPMLFPFAAEEALRLYRRTS